MPAKSFNEEISDDFFVTDKVSDLVDDDNDRFCLKTRNTIPLGCPIKRGRHITLFLLFLLGGALSALLLKGVRVKTLILLPSILLSLLSSELAQRLLLLRKLLSAFFSDFLLFELTRVSSLM